MEPLSSGALQKHHSISFVNTKNIYLHGNLHKPRKVGLSHKMIQDDKLDDITVFPRGQLKTRFMRIVKSECEAARANG